MVQKNLSKALNLMIQAYEILLAADNENLRTSVRYLKESILRVKQHKAVIQELG